MSVETSAKALINAKRDRQRRDMLLVLKADFGHFVSVRVLGDALKHLNHALTDRDVRFHLAYLEGKELVELRRIDVPEARERDVIEGARLLAAGVDVLDGRSGLGVAEF